MQKFSWLTFILPFVLVVIYPSIRCSMLPILVTKAYGRPVEMYISTPLSFALVRASTVDCGIACVLKLTRVPSISKKVL